MLFYALCWPGLTWPLPNLICSAVKTNQRHSTLNPFEHIFKIGVIPNGPIRFLHNRTRLTHNRQIFSFRFVRERSLRWPIKNGRWSGTRESVNGKWKIKKAKKKQQRRALHVQVWHPSVDQEGSHAKLNRLLAVSVRQQPRPQWEENWRSVWNLWKL